MNTHPDAMFTASNLHRNELLRTADRERLAAKAWGRSTRFGFSAARTFFGAMAAALSSVVKAMSGTPRRALPLLLSAPR